MPECYTPIGLKSKPCVGRQVMLLFMKLKQNLGLERAELKGGYSASLQQSVTFCLAGCKMWNDHLNLLLSRDTLKATITAERVKASHDTKQSDWLDSDEVTGSSCFRICV